MHPKQVDMGKESKGKHGGTRLGSGRPRKTEETRTYTFRASGEMVRHLDMQEQKSEYIKMCIAKEMNTTEPDFSKLGDAYPATRVKEANFRFFDIGIVAGFPIPLDNDERSQDIELLQMLCPYPEACYLIRVSGHSMIDANIHDGDIVIVDKSKRNPSPKEVAVCELNGEYTLKHFKIRDGRGWLIPANPDFPEIEISEGDAFRVWGTVTYVIHKPVK